MVGPVDEHDQTNIPRAPVTRVRPARFAGRHYPADPSELRAAIEALFGEALPTGPRPRGLVLPHGPWRMVGGLIAEALKRGLLEENIVILAPNHLGRGPRSSIVCARASASRRPTATSSSR